MTRSRGDSPVDPRARDDKPVIDTSPEPTYTLEELLRDIETRNIHPEINTGPPVGREQW